MAVASRRSPWPAAPALGDVLLVVVALLAAAALAYGGSDKTIAKRVIVDALGVNRFVGDIDSQRTVTVDGVLGPTVIRIEGGRARIESAPCPGQICVNRGWLDASGDVAACVPNHVVLRLAGGAPPLYDGITQ